jgi:hypothetical protein
MALPNGSELSCPAARASPTPFSRTLAGKPSGPYRQPAGSASASCWAAHTDPRRYGLAVTSAIAKPSYPNLESPCVAQLSE